MANVFTFSLQKVMIATANGDGTYGTAMTLGSSKTLTVAAKQVSDKAQGNAVITNLASQIISWDCSLDTAGFDDASFPIVWGVTAASSNGGTNLDVGQQVLMPYFGLIAQVYSSSQAGDVLHFFPYCKVTADTTYRLEFGKIVSPQFKFEAITEPVLLYMWRKRTRTAGGAVTIPPTA